MNELFNAVIVVVVFTAPIMIANEIINYCCDRRRARELGFKSVKEYRLWVVAAAGWAILFIFNKLPKPRA